MGANHSSVDSQSSTEIINSNLSTVSNSVDVNQYSQTEAVQTMKLSFEYDTMDGCNIQPKQFQDVTIAASLNAVSEMNNEQLTALQNSVASEMETALKQTNDGLNIGAVNTSDVNNNVRTVVGNTIENHVENAFSSENITETKSGQEMELTFKGTLCKDSTISPTQETTMNVIAEQISNGVMASLQDNSTVNDVVTKQKTTVEQLNKGIDLAAMMGGSGGSICSSVIGAIVAMKALKKVTGSLKGNPDVMDNLSSMGPMGMVASSLISKPPPIDVQPPPPPPKVPDLPSAPQLGGRRGRGRGRKLSLARNKKVGGGITDVIANPIVWILILCCCLFLGFMVTYLVDRPSEDERCPKKEVCEKNSEEILQGKDVDQIKNCYTETSGDLLSVPRCETICSFAEREERLLTGLYCWDLFQPKDPGDDTSNSE